jgi:alpha-tubulin suppressor-like RCC1 family protein
MAGGAYRLWQATEDPLDGGWPTTWYIPAVFNGKLLSWGKNTYGQLGDGTKTNTSSPIQVGLLTAWLNISCGVYSSAAIKTDGTLWTWGHNGYGQLGLNTGT